MNIKGFATRLAIGEVIPGLTALNVILAMMKWATKWATWKILNYKYNSTIIKDYSWNIRGLISPGKLLIL